MEDERELKNIFEKKQYKNRTEKETKNRKKLFISLLRFYSVRVKGVEPPRLAALDPKSSVSTNSTTPAKRSANINQFSDLQMYSL